MAASKKKASKKASKKATPKSKRQGGEPLFATRPININGINFDASDCVGHVHNGGRSAGDYEGIDCSDRKDGRTVTPGHLMPRRGDQVMTASEMVESGLADVPEGDEVDDETGE